MKFVTEGRHISRGARYLSMGLVAVAIGVLLVLANSQASHAQNGTVSPPAANNDLNRIVYPMLISVTEVTVTGSGSQQTIVIQLNAGNNLALEPNYANATVDLQSLNLVLTYSYQSNGIQRAVVNLQPSASVTLTTNHNETFSVGSGNVAIPAGASVTCSIEGSYTWQLHATLDSSSGIVDRVVNGRGTISQYSQEVTSQ